MDVSIVNKEAFTVIGKMGQGPGGHGTAVDQAAVGGEQVCLYFPVVMGE